MKIAEKAINAKLVEKNSFYSHHLQNIRVYMKPLKDTIVKFVTKHLIPNIISRDTENAFTKNCTRTSMYVDFVKHLFLHQDT